MEADSDDLAVKKALHHRRFVFGQCECAFPVIHVVVIDRQIPSIRKTSKLGSVSCCFNVNVPG